MLNKYKLVVFFLKLFRWVELLSLRGAAEVPGDEGNVSLGQFSLPSGWQVQLALRLRQGMWGVAR